MAARLSHELRTPVAVVKSSLGNLEAQPLPADARVYIERAQGGIARLAAILTRMSEAARLEHSLADVERERFDLVPVVAGCVDGYRQAYPRATFELALPPEAAGHRRRAGPGRADARQARRQRGRILDRRGDRAAARARGRRGGA